MTEEESVKKLKEEGFINMYIWHDDPGVVYPDHAHPFVAAHVILNGEMTIACEGKFIKVKKGERYDVPKNTVHSAKVGTEGCTYIVGEKH